MLLKMKCGVPPYREILWATTLMLQNSAICCERQMSFSLVVAIFDRRGLGISDESKEHPRSNFVLLLSWHFPCSFLHVLLMLCCGRTYGLHVLCYFSDLVVVFVSSLTGPLPPCREPFLPLICFHLFLT